MSDPRPHQRRNQTVTFLWLIVAFALPMLASWVLYLHPHLLPRGRVNHGELIQPPRPLREVRVRAVGGRDFVTGDFRDRWNLVWLARSPCGRDCGAHIGRLKQISLALGENGLRVRRVAILADAGDVDAVKLKLPEFAGTTVLAGPPDAVRDLAAQFPALSPAMNGFYLVDPLGNVMMRYAGDADLKGILKDLERLLKYSSLGR